MCAKTSKAISNSSHSSTQNGFSLISNEKLLEIYRDMLKCNLLGAKLRPFYKRTAPLQGMEAVAAAISGCLRQEDTIITGRNGFYAGLLKDTPIQTLCYSLTASSAENVAHINVALGIALINKVKKNKRAVVVFGGGTDALKDHWQTAIDAAEAQSLPMIFVHEGDPESKHVIRPAKKNGLPTMPVDMDDVVAIYRVASESIARIRADGGPTLIAYTRWALSTPKKNTPIANMERYLASKKLFRKDIKNQATCDFSATISTAIAEIKRVVRVRQ